MKDMRIEKHIMVNKQINGNISIKIKILHFRCPGVCIGLYTG